MSLVAVLTTSPSKVLQDYSTVMLKAGLHRHLARGEPTVLKLNLSWSLFYPACSTPPWQLEGVVRTLKFEGYEDLTAMENKTVVTDPWKGLRNNRWGPVLQKYGVPFVPLTDVEWVEYRPKHDLLVLDKKIFDKVVIPKPLIGSNVVHLPTQKTHGHTTITGAMKNAFGGLLKEVRHHCHTYIHEVLVDLLIIQKEIHKGIFAVMDGTIAGDGPGPRCHIPYVKNHILASGDQVAIDAISAKMMGFDPWQIPFLKIAHDLGLGCADLDQIEVVGDDVSRVDYGFSSARSPVIWGDQAVRKGKLRFLEPLLHTRLMAVPIFLSGFYHDRYWYPVKGRKHIRAFLKTDWGRLFQAY